MERKVIGVKDFHGRVDITDAFYSKDYWYRMANVKIKEGQYTCSVCYFTINHRSEDGSIYLHKKLIETVGIYLLNKDIPHSREMKKIGSIDLDSGLAGFFHSKPDFDGKTWNAFCDRSSHGDAWIVEEGFYSFLGDGDGGYGVFAHKQDGEIDALEIRFI